MPRNNRLHRCTLALLLAAASAPAPANWVVVSDHADYVAYADDASMTREGDVARMNDLIDLKVPRTSPYGVAHSSSLAQTEFDCREPRMRTLAFALHAGQMGDGEMVEEVAPSNDWMPVFDGTLLQTLRAFACN